MDVIGYGQDTLFGRKTISTIGYDEQEIIRDILYLHCDGAAIQCDPTYSTGNFYKKGLPEPEYKFDIDPQLPDVIQADARNLPLDNESIDIMMFDPPFIVGENIEGKENLSVIRNRFGQYKNMSELWLFYFEAIMQAYRVIKPDGTFIFKCQDTVSSGKNYFTHCAVMNMAVNAGFYPLDLFILVAKNRMIDVEPEDQQHARKFHSYFWVFRKKKTKTHEYGIYPPI